jgi:hypothetical protein
LDLTVVLLDLGKRPVLAACTEGTVGMKMSACLEPN